MSAPSTDDEPRDGLLRRPDEGYVPFIKVCGVRDHAVLGAAIEAGVTAIGFNFVPSSRRAVTIEQARSMVAWARDRYTDLPLWVGVFADAPPAEIDAVRVAVGLDLVQLHGHESPDAVAACQPAYKAVRIGSESDLGQLARFEGPFVLIDARVGDRLGGTGQRVPFDLVGRATARRPVIVAGGLDADNVVDVVVGTRPAGVDTASGAEDQAGFPSAEATSLFIAAARAGFTRVAEADGDAVELQRAAGRTRKLAP